MTRSKYPFALFLGAGASKPLGIPTTDEMAKGLLETIDSKYLKSIPDCNELDIESLISNIKLCKELKHNPALNFIDISDYDSIRAISDEFEKDLKETFRYIRKRCSNPDVERAKELYGPIFELSDVSFVKMFTTNYDTSIEDAAKSLKIVGNDGFGLALFEDLVTFDHTSFDSHTEAKYQLFKLHGSINWWSDDNKTFRLPLDLEGTEKIKNMMIYPSQDKDTSTYPYYILQSIFDYTLNSIDELIVIGHRFNDHKITSSIKATLDRNEKFTLTIVNPDATKLKSNLFNNYANVVPIDCKFEEWVKEKILSIREKANEYNKNEDKKLNEYHEMLRKEHIERYRNSEDYKKAIESAVDRGKNSTSILANTIADSMVNTRDKSASTSNFYKIGLPYYQFKDPFVKNCSRCNQEFTSLSNQTRCSKCSTIKNCSRCNQEFNSLLPSEILCGRCRLQSSIPG